jgi:hypothetical protein
VFYSLCLCLCVGVGAGLEVALGVGFAPGTGLDDALGVGFAIGTGCVVAIGDGLEEGETDGNGVGECVVPIGDGLLPPPLQPIRHPVIRKRRMKEDRIAHPLGVTPFRELGKDQIASR